MLFSKSIKPQYSIYYYGAMILNELNQLDSCALEKLYFLMKEKYQISLKLFYLTLDWLYLIDAAIVDKEGKIQWSKSNL